MDTQGTTSITGATEDLFEVLELQDASDEEKASLLLHMIEIVQTRVFDKVYDLLNPDERNQFVDLLNEEDVVEVERFLGQHIANYQDLFDTEAKQLRRQLITKLAA